MEVVVTFATIARGDHMPAWLRRTAWVVLSIIASTAWVAVFELQARVWLQSESAVAAMNAASVDYSSVEQPIAPCIIGFRVYPFGYRVLYGNERRRVCWAPFQQRWVW